MNVVMYATMGVSLGFIPVAGMLPVGLNIYLASNIVSYMAQTYLLDSRRFRDLVGLRPKSFAVAIQEEIAKNNKQLKHVVSGGKTAEVDTEIKGKRAVRGKTGRKVNVKTIRK